MDKDATDLIIHINFAGSDEEELERSTEQLRAELLDLNLESVDLVKRGDHPKGAKGEELVSWGSLLVSLVASGGGLPKLIGTIQSWLSRRENHKIMVQINGDKLEMTGTSNEQQDKLIDAFIKTHS